MEADKINQTLVLNDGRKLGYAEYGDPQGKAVFHFNGSGSSRLEHPADESILLDLGIRFITTDRPGHGISDPQPDRRLLDWPEDIRQLADHLGVETFYVEGHSAGGPHTLACAHQLPERVLAGAIISAVAPPERPNPYEGLPFPNRLLLFCERRVPIIVPLIRRSMYSMISAGPEKAGHILLASFPPVDQRIAEKPEHLENMVASIQEGYRQGWQGPAQDDVITNSPWGFRVEDIKVRIDIWQGEVDENVPLNQGLYQHEKIPNSRLTVLPGQAHVYLLERWGEILAQLLGDA
jgi:pimeloyl-ACP methyl ester carboxylesterase